MRDKIMHSDTSHRHFIDEMNEEHVLRTGIKGERSLVDRNRQPVAIDNITMATDHQQLEHGVSSDQKSQNIYKSENYECNKVSKTESDAVTLTFPGLPTTEFSETNITSLNFPGLPTTNNESDVIECVNGQKFSNSLNSFGSSNQGLTASQHYEKRSKFKVTKVKNAHSNSELMPDNVSKMFENGCSEQQNHTRKQLNDGKQNGGYASDVKDDKITSSDQVETYSECAENDSYPVESQKEQNCEIKEFDKVDLPCLKRRIWSPSKTSPGKNKSPGDGCNTLTENSEDYENPNNSESEYEPKKRRRKQLHPDKNMEFSFWGDTHQPFIEFDNTRMFLKFRKERNTFRCAECDIVFNNESDLITHILSHESETSDKQEVVKGDNQRKGSKNDASCTVTKFETKSGLSGEDLLRMHKEAENKMTRCQYCNVTFPSKKGVEKHISFKHKDKLTETGYGQNKPLVCVLCGKILKTKYSLKKHWQVHSESKDFKCTICDKGFAYRRSLEMHVKGHEYAKQYETQGHVEVEGHNSKNLSKKDNFEEGEPNRLKTDLKNENSKRNEDTGNSSDSDVYITRSDEDGKKVYQCVACMKTFESEPSVIEHAGNGCTLKKNKPQKCPICKKILKTSVADHIRIHTGERPYECSICGKMFKRGYHLQIHQQTAHSDAKPWHCDEPGCGKSFKRKDKLQCHKRTHSTEKPYICLDCGNSYKQSHHLSRHRRRVHDNAKTTKSKMENVEDEIRNELVCVDFNGMEQFIREAYDEDDKTATLKGNGFKDDSNESWDMSKQIAETISNITEKDDS